MNHSHWVNRFIRAACWSAGTSYFFFAFNFIGQIFLARFLLPKDFGLYAYAFAWRDIVLLFLGVATTQSFLYTDANQEQFNANVIINLIGCAILISVGFIGLLFSYWQGRPVFGYFFFILAIAQALTMMSYVYIAPLEKELKYKKVSLQQGFGSIVGTVLAIILASLFHSPWSLVLRDVVNGMVVFGLAYKVGPKKLSRMPDWEHIKYQLHFGFKTSIARGLEIVCYRFPDVLVQTFFGRVALGNFYQARYLCYIPIKIMTPFTQQVLFAFLTHVRDDKQNMSKNIFWLNFAVIAVLLPVVLAVALWGNHLMVLLYGAKWSSAGIYFRYFALFILFGVLFNMMQAVYYSLGLQHHISFAYTLGSLVFFITLSVISKAQYSALGFSGGFLIAYAFLMMSMARRGYAINILQLYFVPMFIIALVVGVSPFLNLWMTIVLFAVALIIYYFLERHRLTYFIKRLMKT